jgi:hypothetical protein
MFATNPLCLSMSGFYFLKFLKLIFLLSPFEKLHHSLFYLSILFLTFFSNSIFQLHLRPSLHFFLRSIFLSHKEQHSKYNFSEIFFISKLRLFEHSSCFLLLNINLVYLIRFIMSSLFSPSSANILPRYLNFGTCFRASSSILILIFSGSLEKNINSVFFPCEFSFCS